MKTIFYMLASTIIIGVFVFAYKFPVKDNLNDYESGIVIDKSTDAIFGNMMMVKRGDSTLFVRCYDIAFDVYQVGDTIKN